MVAVISGSGLGIFGSSVAALGGVGSSGNAAAGRGNDRIYVNTATGNLIVQSQDERLSALGLDLNLVRTYNSQGLLDDDNGDNWRLGLHQRVYGLSGSLNSSGSTVKKVFGDGREVLYTYSVDQSRYIGTDGDGAHDTLTNSDGTWTWTDGSGRNTETYNSAGQLTHSRDADGNTISYGYSGALLTQITDASGQITYLDYNGDNNLDQIRVVSNGQEQTLTRYYYDTSNRLRQVVLDLSPADNTVSLPDANGDGVFESVNGQTYVTTYTYDGTSRRIASITQADGSSVSFTYVQLDGQYRVRTYTDAENRTTTLTYSQPTDSAGSSNASANPAALSTTRTDNYSLNTGALTSPAGAGTWAAAEFLETSNGANATWQSVAFDGSGNGFATWVMNGDVYARRYDAATAQWGTAVRVESSSVLSGAPQLAVDRVTGRAVLAWVQTSGLALSTYDAATSTWGAVQLVVSSGSTTISEDHFSVSVAGNFTAVALLQSDGTRQNLRAMVANNGVWNTLTLLETSTQTASLPQVGIDASGNALVTWRQSDGTAQRVYYSRWSHASQSFSSATLLDSGSGATERPRLSFDGQGNAFAVWGQPDGLQVRRFDATSGTWGSVTSLQSGAAASWDLAVDAQGNALVGWVQTEGATKSAYARRFDATSGTWSTATVLESSTADVSQEKISVALAGRNAVVSWLQTNGTHNDLYAAYLTHGTWSTPQLLDGRTNPAQWPYAAIDSAGNVLVVWEQVDGTGARSIYYARYTGAAYYTIPAGSTWQSIANTLYGVNSAAAGSALQAAMGHPALTTGAPLSGWPATLNVTSTVPGYYTVQSGDTWASITQAIYGTNTAQAVSALQAQLGTPTLAAGLQLTVPAVLSYGGSASAGYLQTDVQDALGLVTTYTQDSAGRLTGVLSPTVDGTRLETRYAYDTEGNVIAITQDPSGLNRVTTFGYDANGNLMLTRDSLGNTVTRTYDSNNQLLTQTEYLVRDPDGAGTGLPSAPQTTRYVYDAESQLRFVISPEGRVTERQYNAAGQLTSTRTFTAAKYTGTSSVESDVAAWTATLDRSYLELELYAYDFRGNVSTIRRYWGTTTAGAPLGTAMVTRFVYDQRGQLLQTIDPRGEATTGTANDYRTVYTYDGLGRVLTTNEWVSSTSTRTTLNTYDDAGRITRTTLANGLVTTRTYNRAGELISVANGTASAPTALGTTTYAYDAAGRLRMQTEPTGVRQFFFYDEAGRQVAHVDGDGSLTEVVYNRAGQTIKTIQYAALLPTAVRATLVDGAGNPASVPLSTLRTAAGGNAANDRITRTVYDASGALVYTIDPSGAVVEHRYDGAGRLTDTIQYANRLSIERTVDEVLPASVTVGIHADDRRTRYFYDDDGLKIGTLDADGYLTEYSYQGAGRLADETRYANQSALGVRASGTFAELKSAVGTDTETATDPERDQVTHYFYDALGRQIGVLDAEGYLTETQYDSASNVSKRIRYDQVLTYRPKLSLMLSAVASTTVRETTAYTYDGDNQLTSEVFSRGTATESSSITTTYSYDAMGHLVSTTRAAGTSEARTTQARYDFLGRVIQELTGEGSAQLAALTNPTSAQIDDVWNRHGITYAYDLAGRKISATVRPDDTQTNTTVYFYDEDNRLRFEVNARGERKEYRYNALNQRTHEIAYVNRIATSGLSGGLLTSALITTLTSEADGARDAQTTYEYTLTGRTASVRVARTTNSADDRLTSFTYNAFGDIEFKLESIDATRTLRTDYSYDKRGQLTLTRWDSVSGGFNTSEARTYDAFGRLRSITDARSNVVRRYEYDRLGRETASVDANTADRTVRTYDAFARVLKVWDALNNLTEYSYDDVNRRMTVTTPERIAVVTTFTVHGQTFRVTAAGNTTEYTYNRDGQLTNVSDGMGPIESRTYDRGGRQITATDARGIGTSFQYDAANRVLHRIVDVAGLALTTSYTYDGQGRVTRVDEPGGRRTETSYYRDGSIEQVSIDPDGLNLRSRYTYDRQGRTLTVTEGALTSNPRVTEYRYDTLGRRTQEIVDPGSGVNPTTGLSYLNLTTQYKYDANGNLTRKIDAENHSTWFVYDADNRLEYTVDALGGVTQTLYDHENRVTATTRYATGVITTGFGDVVSSVKPSVSPQDRTTRSIYDGDGREIYTIDPAGGVTKRSYDDLGNVVRTQAYAKAVTAQSYTVESLERVLEPLANDRLQWAVRDARGRAIFLIDSLGAVIRKSYDGAGNVIATTAYAQLWPDYYLNQPENVVSWANGTAATNSANRTTRYWYDNAGRLVFTLDAENFLTEVRYNDAARTETQVVYSNPVTVPAGATLQNLRDRTGGVAITTDTARDQHTVTAYDAAGRVSRVTDARGNYEEWTYDAVGNKRTYRNQKGVIWQYAYDGNRRLISETTEAVAIYSVTEVNGVLEATLQSAPIVTRMTYDKLGNLKTRTEAYGRAEARTTTYHYDSLGRQVRVTFPPTNYYYAGGDDLSRTGTSVIRSELEDSAPESQVWYDTLGNAYMSRDVAGSYSFKVYDVLGRVQYEVDSERQVTRYFYDTFGNQTTLVRYANPLPASLSTSQQLTETTIQNMLVADEQNDRWLQTAYDRLNRPVSIREPDAFSFDASGSAGSEFTFDDGARTYNVYNAFGQIVRQSRLVNPRAVDITDPSVNATANDWAHTYFYYDERGTKIAEVDALGYLTTYQYDETGDLTRKKEYAEALAAGSWNLTTFGSPTATTHTSAPGNARGYDREYVYVYDRLNRLTSETQLGVEHDSGSFSDVTTSYDYDAVGNRTVVTDALGGVTYSYYDKLGRLIAVAEPPRDTDGVAGTANVTPLTVLSRDAFGNLVQEIKYKGSASANASSYTAPSADPGDHKTVLQVDSYGRTIRSQQALGGNRYATRHASYTKRGEVAKEWQHVTNASGAIETLVTVHEYDSLGRKTAVVEPQRLTGTPLIVRTRMKYNAFGEMTGRGTDEQWQETFEYDRAGRLWRTNTGDGVYKVYLYNLAGKATVEIRSRVRDLKTYVQNAAQALVLLSGSEQIRTETDYDLLGRVTDQRLPTFTSSSLQPITATFTIGQNVPGPNHPGSVYQRVTYDYGGGSFDTYVVNPSATLAQGGGYYYDAATGTYIQDAGYAIVNAVRISWDAPADGVIDSNLVEAKFEYRVLGSTGNYSEVPVGMLSGNRLGANVGSLVNQTYEYRVTYRRRSDLTAYAEATGTFRVDGTNSSNASISRTPPDPAADIPALAATHYNGLLTWGAPTDTSVDSKIILTGMGGVQYNATRAGGSFQVDLGTVLNSAGDYAFEIVYTRTVNGEQQVIARRSGTLRSTGDFTDRVISNTSLYQYPPSFYVPTPAPTGNAASTVASAIASRMSQIDHPPPANPPHFSWSSDRNIVNLQWPSIGSGRVRVLLDYSTRPVGYYTYSSDIPGWSQEWGGGWDVEGAEFVFASGDTSATLNWHDNNGAIDQVKRVRVFKESAPNSGVWQPYYTQTNPTAIYGRSVSWVDESAPNNYFQVGFGIRSGGGSFSELGAVAGSNSYAASLNGVVPGTYEYRIQYRRGNRLIGEQLGTLVIGTNGSVSITPTSNQQYPPETINVSMSGDTIYWSKALVAGGSMQVTWAAIQPDWEPVPLPYSGTSPNFSASFADAGGRYFAIKYFRPGETDPYAIRTGSVGFTVTLVPKKATLSILSQTPIYPSGVQEIAAPSYIGNDTIAWSTAAAQGASVLTRVRSGSGPWIELSEAWVNGQYQASLAGLQTANYEYEISYTQALATTPYAVARGTLQVNRSTTVMGVTITPAAGSNQVLRAPKTHQTLDRWGNVIEVTDAAEKTTRYRYNSWNQVVQITQPEVQVVSTRDTNNDGRGDVVITTAAPVSYNYFDRLGRFVGARDANGHLRSVTLNAAGQVLTETNAEGKSKKYQYDAFGNQIKMTDELEFDTWSFYDGANQLTSVQREVSNTLTITESFAYDEAGRRISETNGENETVRYFYDLNGNLILRRSPMGRDTSYNYDAQGRKIQEVDAIGGTLSWVYSYFGQLLDHRDLEERNYDYAYDYAGLLTSQTNNDGQNQAFTYNAAGALTGINDTGTGVGRVTTYDYDIAGRRSRERTVVNGLVHQDSTIRYDALGRVSNISDLRYNATYSYDAQGNRTNIAAKYYDHQLREQTQDLWYVYDDMNRVTLSQGVRTGNSLDIAPTQGVLLTYDDAGQRESMETFGDGLITYYTYEFWNGQDGGYIDYATQEGLGFGRYKETYKYDGLGRWTTTEREVEHRYTYGISGAPTQIYRTVTTVASATYDNASRTLTESNFWTGNNSSGLVRNVYDDDGRLTEQHRPRSNGTVMVDESLITYNYDDANVLRSYTMQVWDVGTSASGPHWRYTSTFTNYYRRGESYQEQSQYVSTTGPSSPPLLPGSTLREYNANGELVAFRDTQNAAKNRFFANNASGQALTVVRGNITDSRQAFENALERANNGSKAQHFFFANGQAIGSFGQLLNENDQFEANFDVNFTPISDQYPANTPSEVVVQAGDTLRTIAARAFGDSNLWYIIAQENGLSDPEAALPEGMQLRIPNDVISLSNASGSFKPYDPTAALGDTSPTQPLPPPPKKKGCGVVGQILVIVVAIVVTYLTAGALSGAFAALGPTGSAVATAAVSAAAGSVVSQGVAIAIGQQDSFSWKSVAAAAVTAGILKGTGVGNVFGTSDPTFTQAALQGAVNSAVSQGVNITLGLQDSFSWREVAISSVSSGVSSKVTKYVGGDAAQKIGWSWAKSGSYVAGGVSSALVRRAFGGRMETDAVLADVFGNALGNSIVDGLQGASQARAQNKIRKEVRAQNPELADFYDDFVEGGGDPAAFRQLLQNQKTRGALSTLALLNATSSEWLDSVAAEDVWSSVSDENGGFRLNINNADTSVTEGDTFGTKTLHALSELQAGMNELQQHVPVEQMMMAAEVAILGPAAFAVEAIKSQVVESIAGEYIAAGIDKLATALNAGAHRTDLQTMQSLLDPEKTEAAYISRFDEYEANPNAETLAALNQAQEERPQLLRVQGEVRKAQAGAELLAVGILAGLGKISSSLGVSARLRALKGVAKESKWVNLGQLDVDGPGLRDHFKKHGGQVGAKTAREYDLSARLTIQHGRRFTYIDKKTYEPRIGYYDPDTKLFTSTSHLTGKDPMIHTHYPVEAGWAHIKTWKRFSFDD